MKLKLKKQKVFDTTTTSSNPHEHRSIERFSGLTNELDVEDVGVLAGPPVLQVQVDDMYRVLDAGNEQHRDHGQRVEQDPRVERGLAAALVVAPAAVDADRHPRVRRQPQVHAQGRNPDLEHPRDADLADQVQRLEEDEGYDELHDVKSLHLLRVDRRAVEHLSEA